MPVVVGFISIWVWDPTSVSHPTLEFWADDADHTFFSDLKIDENNSQNTKGELFSPLDQTRPILKLEMRGELISPSDQTIPILRVQGGN